MGLRAVILGGVPERDRRSLKQGHPSKLAAAPSRMTLSECDSAVKRLDLNAVEYTMLLTFRLAAWMNHPGSEAAQPKRVDTSEAACCTA